MHSLFDVYVRFSCLHGKNIPVNLASYGNFQSGFFDFLYERISFVIYETFEWEMYKTFSFSVNNLWRLLPKCEIKYYVNVGKINILS